MPDGAWLDLRPGWVIGADALFERLLETVPWRAERRQMYDNVVDVPRLLSFYDADQARPDPVLDQAMLALDAHYGPELGEPLSTVGLCLYRDGRDSVAWHGDTSGRKVRATIVAIVFPRQSACARPAPARRGPPLRSRSGTATCWSWAAPASAPGSTPCRRRHTPLGRGSACSSGRGACAELPTVAGPGAASGRRRISSRCRPNAAVATARAKGAVLSARVLSR